MREWIIFCRSSTKEFFLNTLCQIPKNVKLITQPPYIFRIQLLVKKVLHFHRLQQLLSDHVQTKNKETFTGPKEEPLEIL